MKLRFTSMLLSIAIVCVGNAAHAQLNPQTLAERSAVAHRDGPRKVLAFYYPWYGNPEVDGGSGRAAHWDGIDEVARAIASSTNYPQLGPYDSHDPRLIAQHCAWAKQAGIDGFVASWWGRGTFEDRAMPRILHACRATGLEVSVYYEAVPDPKNLATAVDDLLYILKRYADHPAWLRVEGKPVVFVYSRAVQQIGFGGWLNVITEVNRRFPGGAIIIGDRIDRGAARVFDGIHTYNPESMLRERCLDEVKASVAATYPAWVETAEARSRISTITVIPGYDDTKIRKPGLAVPRLDGELYRAQWEAVLSALPDWVLITSWNEWHEGSEIEPSREHGDRYLALTAEYAARFKAAPARPAPHRAESAGITDAERTRLRERYKDIGVAMLPDADFGIVGTLIDLGITPQQLAWEEVASLDAAAARRRPLMIYAGPESYRRTVTMEADVDDGLLRYLRGGGTLVALPAAPTPFHYDEHGKDVAHSGKFGLPISVGGPAGGWEQPPANRELRFVATDFALPHVKSPLPFPTHGDQRWRPFGARTSAGERVASLLELGDTYGNSYGSAVSYIEHKDGELKGGRAAYVWFRLLESPEADGLLYDLFAFLSEQIADK